MRATYGGWHRFHTASIVKADILAAMLLHHQTLGTPITASERQLATQMIENSDNDAAQDLWNDDDEADGIAAADARLGLGHTAPGEGGYWGLTSTTVRRPAHAPVRSHLGTTPRSAPPRGPMRWA